MSSWAFTLGLFFGGQRKEKRKKKEGVGQGQAGQLSFGQGMQHSNK